MTADEIPAAASDQRKIIERVLHAVYVAARKGEPADELIGRAAAQLEERRFVTTSAERKAGENAAMVAKYLEITSRAGGHFPGAVGKVARLFALHASDVDNLARRLRRELTNLRTLSGSVGGSLVEPPNDEHDRHYRGADT